MSERQTRDVAERDSAQPSSPRPRLAWIDAVRGVCIVLVVLFHVFIWVYRPFDGLVAGPIASGWQAVVSYAAAFRMPILFAVSGLVVAPRVLAGWAAGGIGRRSLGSFYLYAVWLGVYAVLSMLALLVFGADELPHQITSVGSFLLQLVLPETPLWYLFALGVYVPLMCLLRRAPRVVVLAGAGAVFVLLSWIVGDGHQFVKVPLYFVFFACGVYGRRLLLDFAARPRLLPVVVVILVFGALQFGNLVADGLLEAVLRLGGNTAGILLTIVAVVFVIRWSLARRLLGYLGSHTLAIYVLHVPVLWGVLLATRGFLADALGATAVAVTMPVVVVALTIVLCILLEKALTRAHAGSLFQLPRRWAQAGGINRSER